MNEPKGGWPCARHEAHGSHTVKVDTVTGYQCPGVQAHPNTSIGGRHDGQPAMYGQIDVGHLTGGE